MIHSDRYRAMHRKANLWQMAAVALTSVTVTAAALLWWSGRIGFGGNRMARLVDVAAQSNRPFESRPSGGFKWTPLVTSERSAAPRNARIALNAAVSEIVASTQFDGSDLGQHESAIALLTAGKLESASKILETLAVDGAQGTVWNDLAAARYALAVRKDDGATLVAALGAVDISLRSDPRLVEALFNRALIVERMGLHEQAREAWDEYLVVDPSSEWATEARDHVRKLVEAPLFQDELARNYEVLASNDATAQAFARRFPQDARLWGETEILGRWASAERAGKSENAAKHLRVAAAFGVTLSRARGDAMLQSLVAAIERANATEKEALVDAHEAFRAAQLAYKKNQPAEAERIFVEAADAFERGRSPGLFLARYFLANTAFSLGRIDESREKLTDVLAVLPARFVACRAQVLWQLGLVHMARARWDDTINSLRESALLFERLNELRYAANVREILGNAHARVGNSAEAATQRMLALRELGRRSSPRLLTIVTSLGQSAALSGDSRAANALFRLAVDVADRIDDPFIESSTLLLRARVHVRHHDRAAAKEDLLRAEATLARIHDPGYRALVGASATHVKALLTSDAREASELLAQAIEFNTVQGRRARLPELFLDRGRSYLTLGDIHAAAADFEAGIAELESSRETIADLHERVGIFDEADALFEEAIVLALRQNDDESAFLYSERSRARALLDALGVRWPVVNREAIPRDALILEYFVNDKDVTIFSVDRKGVRAMVSRVDRATLLREASAIVTAARLGNRVELRKAGARLHQRLIAPVAAELTGKRAIIVVPDPNIENVPFAALVDEAGQFVLERFVIVVSPSAAVFARTAASRTIPTDPRVLVVTGDESLGELSALEREARSVARLYRRVTYLPREIATPEMFVREARTADVVHFAGHAIESSPGAPAGFLALQSGKGGDRKLDAKEIASLRLGRTSLVVLAACSTAAGEVRQSEGTISIARSFLAAGVPVVIATLWRIDDQQAAEFFPVVHRYLARGLPAPEAVRAAQLEWMQKPDMPDALWTAVQAIGR